MLKKVVLASIISIPAFVSNAYADNGHFGVGFGYNSLTKADLISKTLGNPLFNVNVTYSNDIFEAGFGASYTRYTTNSGDNEVKHNVTPVLANIGLRHYLTRNLYVNYGINGAYRFVDRDGSDSSADSYSIGAYVGLSYQLSQHLVVSATANPYIYTDYTKGDSAITHDIFSQGSINFTYLFA